MNIIGNKMFAYIDNHNELSPDMINQYNSSLIFLGDEKQIFVPLINAYVGLGTSAYTYLLNKIAEGNSNLEAFNEYIHKDTVTSIYTQFAPNDIEEAIERGNGQNINLRGKLINNDSAYTYFKANRNVVIKGLNQVNDLDNTVNNNVRSGIDINIIHTGEKQEIIYNGVSYSYYAPYDIITVDDTKTWTYITNSNTYMTEFVTKFATQQANRVYKNILGESDEYIEKSFNEAFLYDEVTGTLNIIKPVYVKTNTGNYSEVIVENTADGYRIKTTIGGTQYIVYSTITGDTVANLSTILADKNNNGLYGGYYENAETHQLIPYWYNYENTGTEGNTNIVDGIQTLKEVAYILDRITDGAGGDDADDGIQLAYNIAWNHDEIIKLKSWQDDIGNQTVSSFKSDSNTDLLTVNYYSTNLWDKDGNNNSYGAIGHVELDLDLKLAQTYEINGVSYAAYYNGQPGITRTTYIITDNDITNIKNYICLTDSTKNNNTYQNLINYIVSFPGWNGENSVRTYKLTRDPNDSNIITGREEFSIGNNATNEIAVSSLSYQSTDDVYIWFPYKKADYQFDQGLTNVKWVTSYVRSTHEDLVNRITTTDGDIRQLITETINGLAYTDIDKSSEGQFVTQVNEVNGVISVNRTKLPLDHILQNDIFYTEYSYIHIDTASIPDDTSDIYILNNGKYQPFDRIQTNLTDTIHDNIYYRMSLASMISVPAGTTVDTLLTNAGGVSYFYKEQNTNSGVVSYLPLNIQAENKTGGLLANSEVAADNTIYYLNSSVSISNIKYFDLSTIQMNNGSTTTIFTTYITYLAAASETNSGLADAWDVRRTIESMFQWVNVKTNTLIL